MHLRIAALLTLIVTLFAPAIASAQIQWGQAYGEKIKNRQTIGQLGPELFGEQINLFDGTTAFSVTDIDLPGNNALPVRVGRKLSFGSPNNAAFESLFGNWEMDIPYLSNVSYTSYGWQVPPSPSQYWRVSGASPYARCSSPQQQGDVVTNDVPNSFVNGGNGELYLLTASTSPKLVRPTIPGVRWVTKDFWYLGCEPTLASGHLGEGFWAVDPSGNKYTFNWMVRSFYPSTVTPALQSGAQIVHNRSELRLYPTLVQDRFGNWVQYQWQGRKLLSIVASDGRRIDFAYGADDQIVSATAHGKTWTYGYNDSATPGVGGLLLSVTNPDSSTWTYTAGPGNYVAYEPRYELRLITTPGGSPATTLVEIYEKVTFCSYDKYLSTAIYPFEIKHPSGARGTFNFKTMRHGRTHVPGECQLGWDDGGDGGYQDAAQNSHNLYPAFKDVWSLQSKVIQGPGLSPATWQYSYAGLEACVAQACTNNPVPTRKTVTVTDPDGSTTVSTFGKIYGEDESQLLSVERRSGATVLSRTDHTYVNNAEIGLMPFPDMIGLSATEYADNWSSGAYRPQRTTVTTQQGAALTRAINSFDAFTRPLSVSRYSPWYSKTETTEYHHDLGKWVIGQVRKVTNNATGVVVEETEYNAQAQPWKNHKFGKLVNILSYWPDGSLNTDTDANGNTIWLGNYHRGIPRTIGYPATPEAPQGATETAVVNDLGWITEVTDETQAKTCYGYDAMGRISSIVYPSDSPNVCDNSQWNPVSLGFQQINIDEHGLPAGHWRHHRYEGNKHVNTYYDALWRPVLEETLDASDIGNTLSQVVKGFDTEGRVTFQSYPTRNVGNYWDVTQGVRTQYDALDRVTRTEQDSEHGALVTTTEYLPNFQVRVTNPRGLQTTLGHLVYDAPDYDTPVWIAEPENKVTEIVRDAYDRTTVLIRRSADNSQRVERKYVYDVAGRLCKTIEPETGATWFGYDEAGNLVASSAGLNLPDANTCNWAEGVNSPRKVTRTYDARHRLKTLNFPDGRGNQVWTYEKDGLTASITTYNDPGNTTPVINAYTYNTRRLTTGESSSQTDWYTWGIGYNYDRNGNLLQQSYPSGLSLNYAPNALGQPTQVRDQNNKAYASAASYYPNGALKQFTYGNGLVHSMTQNARQLPARVTSSGGALDFGYTYDRNGNIDLIWDYARDNGNGFYGRWMTYDGLDRLTSAGSCTFGGDCWHRFTYDPLDNLKSWKLAGVKDYAEYVYDTSHRLTNIRNTAGATVVGLAYDVQGNLSNKNGQTFEFDYGNRLRGATGKEYYRYDGHGRRVLNWRYPTASTPNGTLSLSQYSQNGQLLFQWDDQYPKYSENIYLAGSVIAIRDIAHPNGAVTVKYQHTDALGSPVAVTNDTGAVIERNDYEPWGAIIGKPAFNGIGYTGHMMDSATGLTYMQQRYYDQSIGRFLSVDPVTADAATGAHFNRYWYADNNPYKYNDPDGRAAHVAIGAAAGGIFGGGVELYKQIKAGEGIDIKAVMIETGKGALVGAVTAAMPGAGGAAASALGLGTKTARVATVVGTAGAGSAGEAGAQLAKGQKLDGRQIAVAGIANVAGAGVGAAAAKPAKALSTVTTEAIPGAAVKSLRGRTFTVGAVPAVSSTSKAQQAFLQESADETASTVVTEAVSKSAQPKRR